MHEPWFRRYLWLSYKPIRWQGWVVIAAMAAVALPLTVLSDYFAASQPVLSWLSAGAAGAAVIAGHVLVVWKLERNYSAAPDPGAVTWSQMRGCILQVLMLIVAFIVFTILLNVGR